MKKKYYKVVSEIGGELYSAVQNNKECDSLKLRVKYIPDQWVKPRIEGTQLMVFTNRREAVDFLNDFGHQIWECEVKNPKKDGIFFEGGNLIPEKVIGFLSKILKRKKNHKKYMHLSFHKQTSWYGKMAFVSEVKLTKRIK